MSPPTNNATATAESTLPGRPWHILIPAWFLGLFFIVSAVAKMLSPGAFELYVVQQQVLPSRESAAYAVRFLLAAELFLGLLCFQRAWFRRFTLPAVAGLLLGFSFYLAYLAFVRHDSTSCHCFGELLPMSPRHSLFKNLALLVLVVYLYAKTKGWPPGSWPIPVGLGFASVLIVLVFCPIRHIAVQSTPTPTPAADSPFAKFRDFSGGRTVDLTKGTCLAVFVSLDCDHCHKLVTRIGEAARQEALPPIYLLCLGDATAAPALLTATATDFPYANIDQRLFFDFVGEWPPRLYLLEDGQVRKYWDGEEFSARQLAPWWPRK